MTNTKNPVPPTTPKTSDRNNPLQNGIGLGISLVLAGFAFVYKKKYTG
ncbi:LPXTG cell wall anchor domain-containing protein [Solobacterium moorei]